MVTALMLASATRRFEIVDALLKKGADVDAKDNEGRTALVYATYPKKIRGLPNNDVNDVMRGSIKEVNGIMSLLVKNGADVRILKNIYPLTD